MPLQKLDVPTLESVNEEIQVLEKQHSITTDELLCNDAAKSRLEEDVVMEWMYLAEQRRVLREMAVGNLYAHASKRTALVTRNYDCPEDLAA